jgi:hypothetical protein
MQKSLKMVAAVCRHHQVADVSDGVSGDPRINRGLSITEDSDAR